ncbi:MAG: cytochrome c peroxidase [Pseudomonadota bacterium]
MRTDDLLTGCARLRTWCVLIGLLFSLPVGADPLVTLSTAERAVIAAHAGWPAPWQPDDSNRVSGDPLAAAVGAALFFDKAVSAGGDMACSTCHRPDRWFTDGRRRAQGRQLLKRNTPTVVDSRWQRWFGWGGAHDSLWSQSLRALTAPDEMGASAADVAAYLRRDQQLSCGLAQAFDTSLADADDEALLVMAGKALAAYQESIVTRPSPFDRFAAAVIAGDVSAMQAYPPGALAGLKLFVGRGRCSVCHLGPRFTNDEFADVAVPYFVDGGVDKGRFAGIRAVRDNPYNRLGVFSDADADSQRSALTQFVARQGRNFGEFRVPSLRNVTRTAPYMHDGSLKTLAEVVEHYSELNEERLHASGAQLLRALRLDDRQKNELLAFLRSLTSDLVESPDHDGLLAARCPP